MLAGAVMAPASNPSKYYSTTVPLSRRRRRQPARPAAYVSWRDRLVLSARAGIAERPVG